MTQQNDEIKRMQQLAGILKEYMEVDPQGKLFAPVTYTRPESENPERYQEEVKQIKKLIQTKFPEYVGATVEEMMDEYVDMFQIALEVFGIKASPQDIYDSFNDENDELLGKIKSLNFEHVYALKQAAKELKIKII